MVGANVIAADSDAEALRLFTSVQQSFIALRRSTPGQLPPPMERIEDFATTEELGGVNRALAVSFVGDQKSVRNGLISFLRNINPDELMITGHIYNHAARLRSFEIAADVLGTIEPGLDSSAA